MAINVDDALARLAAVPAPPGLDGIEADLLDRIARMPPGVAAGVGSGMGVIAIGVALLFGVIGAGISPTPARAAPFGLDDAPMPSTLLTGA